MSNLNTHDILFLFSDDFKELREKIEREYDLLICGCDLAPFISFTSKKAIIHTDRGSFFLKEKPIYCSAKTKRDLAAAFQSYLSRRFDFVPKIIKTVSGEYYIKWNNRFYFLTDFVSGRSWDGSNDDIKKVLHCLAKIQASSYFFRNGRNGSKMESYDILNLLELCRKYLHTREDEDVFREILIIIGKLTRDYDGHGNKKFLISHGDFSVLNIIFNQNKVVAINDFDNTAYFPRLHDPAEFFVTSTIINYSGTVTNFRYPIFTRFQKDKMEIILSYYKENFNFSEEDILLFMIITKIIWLEIMLLAVVKEDYLMRDLDGVVRTIKLSNFEVQILNIFSKKVC